MFISALYFLDYEFVVQSFNIRYGIGICTHDSCDDGMYPPLLMHIGVHVLFMLIPPYI